MKISLYHHIMPGPANGDTVEEQAFTEMLRRHATDQSLGIIASEQQRGDIEDKTVDEIAPNQGGIEGATAFYQQTGNPEPSELPKEICQRNMTFFAGNHQHIDTLSAEQADLSSRRHSSCGDESMGFL